MATIRLTFLYPPLFRSLLVGTQAAPKTQIPRLATQPRCLKPRGFATTGGRRQRFVQRHGKAVEPESAKRGRDDGLGSLAAEEMKEAKKNKEVQGQKQEAVETGEQGEKPEATELDSSSVAPLSEETQAAGTLPGDASNEILAGEKESIQQQAPQQNDTAANATDPLASIDTVLRMPPPESAEAENAAKPPHLQTPPYVHHFDTYTLVQQVEAGGFTTEQSITAMKAVRGLLALNLDVAKAGLVSKSDVENEMYLFRAACSELRTEIQNSRRLNDENMRRDRTLLQHEVDILNQKLTQELLSLKDDLKGMFDDRKMAVRMEQQAMKAAIQELDYEITVSLNSDSKSEVEGLRWVLTRRSVMGILFMALMVLSSLRYASYKAHENEVKNRREASARVDKIEELPAQGAAEILAAN